jgi:hypothetical protein
VALNSGLAKEEPVGDLGVRLPLGYQANDVKLASAEVLG